MWASLVGGFCGIVGLALVASGTAAPALAETTEVHVRVADYVLVAGSDGAPEVESNVAVNVVVDGASYIVTAR